MRRAAATLVGICMLSGLANRGVAQGPPPPAPILLPEPVEAPAPPASNPPASNPPALRTLLPRPAQFPPGEPIVPAQLTTPVASSVANSAETSPHILPDDIQRCAVQCCPASEGYFTAGGGFYLIRPYFTSNPIGVYQSSSGITTTRLERDFHQHLETAPLAWVGYISETGLGFRVRSFEFCQGSNSSFVLPSGAAFTSAAPLGLSIRADANEGFAATSDVMLSAWDFEATKLWRCPGWGILGAAGIRYAHVAQDYLAATSGIFGVKDSEYLDSGHNFNGAGPTVAVDVKRIFGDTGFAVYSNARAALLFGNAHQRVFREVDSSTTGLPVALADSASFQATVLPIGELEFGAEYRRDLGHVDLFIQAGLVGQIWWGAGNTSNSSILNGGSFRADNTGNLGFLGMAFRLGVNF